MNDENGEGSCPHGPTGYFIESASVTLFFFPFCFIDKRKSFFHPDILKHVWCQH